MKHNQNGSAETGLVIGLVICAVLLVGAIAFGGWAYSGYGKYKNDSDQLSAQAAQAASDAQSKKDAAKYAEEAKKPLVTYTGPEAYGSISLQYPKTWSGYVDASGQGNAQVDGYFNPGIVPSVSSPSSIVALRLQVVNQSYSDYMNSVVTNMVQQNAVKASPYALPKLPSQVGTMLTGAIQGNGSTAINGEEIVLPLRGSTLLVYTLGTTYMGDFNNNILPNLTFKP